MIHWAVLLVAFLVALAVPFQFGTLWLLGSMTVFLLLLSWSISWRKGQRSGEGFVAADRSSWIFWVMVAVIAVMIPLVAGTPDQMIEDLRRYRDAGCDEFIVPGWTLGDAAAAGDAIDLLTESVVPALR